MARGDVADDVAGEGDLTKRLCDSLEELKNGERVKEYLQSLPTTAVRALEDQLPGMMTTWHV